PARHRRSGSRPARTSASWAGDVQLPGGAGAPLRGLRPALPNTTRSVRPHTSDVAPRAIGRCPDPLDYQPQPGRRSKNVLAASLGQLWRRRLVQVVQVEAPSIVWRGLERRRLSAAAPQGQLDIGRLARRARAQDADPEESV